MMICDKKFSETKSYRFQLNKIHGISISKSKNITALFGLTVKNNIKILNPYLKFNIAAVTRDLIEKHLNCVIEGKLRYKRNAFIRGLKESNRYKSLRFNQNLPLNGQRTHTSAKTQKKKRYSNKF